MRAKEFLDKPTMTPKQVAKKHGVSVKYVNKQLVDGVKHEHEHTSDTAIAREIALDHLGEDPHYYEKLSKVEKVDEDDDDDMFSDQRPPAIQTAVDAGLDWLVTQYYDQMQEITSDIENLYPDEVEDYDEQISELESQLEAVRKLHDVAETLSVTLGQDGWLKFVKLRNNLNNDALPEVLSDLNNYLKSSGININIHNIGNLLRILPAEWL
jgi:hypothetical protein